MSSHFSPPSGSDSFSTLDQTKTKTDMSTAAPAAGQAADVPQGLYCSTSGTYFTDKEALAAHYRSDFHRSAVFFLSLESAASRRGGGTNASLFLKRDSRVVLLRRLRLFDAAGALWM